MGAAIRALDHDRIKTKNVGHDSDTIIVRDFEIT